MVDQRFFSNHGPFTLGELAEWTHSRLLNADAAPSVVSNVAPLDRADSGDVSFFDNSKYLEQFKASRAGACFVRDKFVDDAPVGMVLLINEDPYRAYALAAQRFYPAPTLSQTVATSAHIAPTAIIGEDVSIAHGAVIGLHVRVGNGANIGANAVIEAYAEIGENTVIGPNAVISHAIIGKECIIHRGVMIGQDGFGFAMGRTGHVKVPQLGRVIIEDNVEIGANSCIDRGAGPDTIIGAGTKIDNLVQIGHNVQIGKQAVIVALAGISGSTHIGDGVVIGGQVGVAGHLKIGAGVKLAARSGVSSDLTAGGAYGGTPAVPIKDWHRQVVALNRLIKRKTS